MACRAPGGLQLDAQVGGVSDIDGVGQAAGQELVALDVAPAGQEDGGAGLNPAVPQGGLGAGLIVPQGVGAVVGRWTADRPGEHLTDRAGGIEAARAVPLADLAIDPQGIADLIGESQLGRDASRAAGVVELPVSRPL